MASINMPGTQSGINVHKLVSQLVAAKRAPKDKHLTQKTREVKQDMSAIGALQSALDAFKSSLKPLHKNAVFDSRVASVGNDDIVTAQADGDAVVGRYSLTVNQLAQAARVASSAYANADTVIGTGQLTLTVNGQQLKLNLKTGNDTLAGIRDAINNAPDNPGVSASIINASDGSHLVLSSEKTGTANAVHVTTTGDSALQAFVAGLKISSPAADAEISLDGYPFSGSTNTVSGVIDGVTLDLQQAAPNKPTTLEVGLDRKAAKGAIKEFVDSYNKLVSVMDQLSHYDQNSKQAGPLSGDPTLMRIESQLRRIIGGAIETPGQSPGAARRSLGDIGIQYQLDGSLSLNSGQLDRAMNTHFKAVGALLGGKGGYVDQLDKALSAYLGNKGAIDVRSHSLNNRLNDINDAKSALDRRMDSVADRYRRKFSSLDKLVRNMRHTNAYVNRQFGAMSAQNNSRKS